MSNEMVSQILLDFEMLTNITIANHHPLATACSLGSNGIAHIISFHMFRGGVTKTRVHCQCRTHSIQYISPTTPMPTKIVFAPKIFRCGDGEGRKKSI